MSVFDHGLLYGDGIFEGIRAYNGRVFKLKEHIDRLFYSAKAILLNIPMSPAEAHEGHRRDLPRKQTARRLHPPGRDARRGHARLESAQLQKSVGHHHRRTKSSFIRRKYYQRGMDIVTVPTTRNLHSALNPAIKSLNYLNNILAKIEANNAGVRGGGDAERRGFRGRMHGRQSVHRQERRAVHAAALGRRALRHHRGRR